MISGPPTGMFVTTARFPPAATQVTGGAGLVQYAPAVAPPGPKALFRVTKKQVTWCLPAAMFPTTLTVAPPEAAFPNVAMMAVKLEGETSVRTGQVPS